MISKENALFAFLAVNCLWLVAVHILFMADRSQAATMASYKVAWQGCERRIDDYLAAHQANPAKIGESTLNFCNYNPQEHTFSDCTEAEKWLVLQYQHRFNHPGEQ